MTNRARIYKPSDFSIGQVHEFLVAFGKQGGASRLLQLAIEDQDFMAKIVDFWRSGGQGAINLPADMPAKLSHETVREIMRSNFFGVEEAIKYFGVKPTQQQLDVLAEIPFTEKELEENRKSHILIAFFPLSILDIRNMKPELFFNDNWYDKYPFAEMRGTVNWYLVRKTPVANSINKWFGYQEPLLGKNEEIPKTNVLVYTIIGYFLATNECLFENIYVRSMDVATHETRHIQIGHFVLAGLRIVEGTGHPIFNVGLASIMKSSI